MSRWLTRWIGRRRRSISGSQKVKGRKKWKGIARIEFVRIRLKVQLHELQVASSAVELNKEKENFRVNGMLTTWWHERHSSDREANILSLSLRKGSINTSHVATCLRNPQFSSLAIDIWMAREYGHRRDIHSVPLSFANYIMWVSQSHQSSTDVNIADKEMTNC